MTAPTLESLCRSTGVTLKDTIWSPSVSHIYTLVMFSVCSCAVKIKMFPHNFFVLTKDGRPAPELCFKKVNEAGDMFGNCGKDLLGKYRTCKDRWRYKIYCVAYFIGLTILNQTLILFFDYIVQGCEMWENPVFNICLQAHWKQCCSHRNHRHCGHHEDPVYGYTCV